MEVVPEKGVIGKQFRKEAKPLIEWLTALDNKGAEELEGELEKNGWVRGTGERRERRMGGFEGQGRGEREEWD